MRELKDFYTACSDGIADPVLRGVVHGLRQQLDLPSPDTMPDALQSLLGRACEACEAASSEPDAELAV
ncbi:hypothetical protein ACRAWG_15400 [Methylobacterium sp. P31]